jgi:hypothetical protein
MALRFTTRELQTAIAPVAVSAACLRPVLLTDSANATTLEAPIFVGGWFESGASVGHA